MHRMPAKAIAPAQVDVVLGVRHQQNRIFRLTAAVRKPAVSFQDMSPSVIY